MSGRERQPIPLSRKLIIGVSTVCLSGAIATGCNASSNPERLDPIFYGTAAAACLLTAAAVKANINEYNRRAAQATTPTPQPSPQR